MKLSRGGVFRAMACASAVAGMVVLASSAASAADGGGTSVASASLVRPGVPEYGNTASGSVAQPPNAQCNSNIQFWKIPLLAGDQVTVTGRAISPASNINVWFYPPGTTDASFSSGNFPNPDWSGSTNGGPTAGGTLGQSIVFTVPATGVYPVLIGQCGGQDGPYEFEVSVKQAALYSAHTGGAQSVSRATLVRAGVREFGNSYSGPSSQPPNAQCNSNIQFWKIPLLAGDQVTVTGRAISPASNINVWFYPVGTTDESFTSGNFPNPHWSGSTNGGPTAGGTLGQSIVFTVPATGVYPVLIGQCGGQDGPYEFQVSVRHAAVLYSRSLLRTGVTGDLIAYVRTPGGHPISDPSLVVTLYGFWRDNSVLPVSKHLVAKAHVSGGVVRLPFHLPAATVHKAVTFILVAAGPDYLPSNHLNVKDIVS